jgi:peptide/nickel transport system substrate-binding protein
MDSLIAEEMPAIPLWYDEVLNLLQPRISGYRANPRNMMELRHVRKNKQH